MLLYVSVGTTTQSLIILWRQYSFTEGGQNYGELAKLSPTPWIPFLHVSQCVCKTETSWSTILTNLYAHSVLHNLCSENKVQWKNMSIQRGNAIFWTVETSKDEEMDRRSESEISRDTQIKLKGVLTWVTQVICRILGTNCAYRKQHSFIKKI